MINIEGIFGLFFSRSVSCVCCVSESVRVNLEIIMIDWLTILLALGIIATLVGIFGLMAWKINMPDPLLSGNSIGTKDDGYQLFEGDKKKKAGDQAKKKRKPPKNPKRENKDDEQEEHSVKFKEPTTQTSEETDNEQEDSEQVEKKKQYFVLFCTISIF